MTIDQYIIQYQIYRYIRPYRSRTSHISREKAKLNSLLIVDSPFAFVLHLASIFLLLLLRLVCFGLDEAETRAAR